ncbi:hypothetical protein HN499_01845 [archaeon]|jgi:hypothetical protein|nr:hypothetical protein [archaeon]
MAEEHRSCTQCSFFEKHKGKARCGIYHFKKIHGSNIEEELDRSKTDKTIADTCHMFKK